MPLTRDQGADPPTAVDLAAWPGAMLVEFGTGWCGHCLAAQPLLAAALQGRGDVRHLKVEDGRGRSLGRAFGVKLWPTLVLLVDGVEVGRSVRPTRQDDLARLLATFTERQTPSSSDGGGGAGLS